MPTPMLMCRYRRPVEILNRSASTILTLRSPSCYGNHGNYQGMFSMKHISNDRGSLPILVAIIAVLLIVAAGVAVYNLNKHQKNAVTTTTSPSTSSAAKVNSSTTPQPSPDSTFDIADLGVKFTLTGSLWDLEHKVVHLTGDQAVNSVEFSTKRLDAVGCGLDSAPLGYLTYDSDKGGAIVATARNQNLYYLQPTGVCKAEASLQNWQALESSLRSIIFR